MMVKFWDASGTCLGVLRQGDNPNLSWHLKVKMVDSTPVLKQVKKDLTK